MFRNWEDLQHIVYSDESFVKPRSLKAPLWSFRVPWNSSDETIIFTASPKSPKVTSVSRRLQEGSSPVGSRWVWFTEESWAATWWGCGRGETDWNQTSRRRNTKRSLGLWGSHIQSTTNNERGNTFFLRHSTLLFVLEMCFTQAALLWNCYNIFWWQNTINLPL